MNKKSFSIIIFVCFALNLALAGEARPRCGGRGWEAGWGRGAAGCGRIWRPSG